MAAERSFATVILAGGRATRLPGKLALPIDGVPMLARVYRNVRSAAPTVIASAGSFEPELDALLDCPFVVDRWPDRGPLAGLLSACLGMRARYVFAVAGDAPHIGAATLDMLRNALDEGDEAVVPEHEGHIEPLAALYDREAIEREAPSIVHDGNGSMRALLDRLRVRRVTMNADDFLNVNTPADFAGLTRMDA